MTQTLTGRLGDLLASLLWPAGGPDGADARAASTDAGSERADDEERLPERDESFYWTMHAHW